VSVCALSFSPFCSARGRVPFPSRSSRGFQDSHDERRMRLHRQFASSSFCLSAHRGRKTFLYEQIALFSNRFHPSPSADPGWLLRICRVESALYWLHRKSHNHPAQCSRGKLEISPTLCDNNTRVPTHQLCQFTSSDSPTERWMKY
jgi:hypothetical protein